MSKSNELDNQSLSKVEKEIDTEKRIKSILRKRKIRSTVIFALMIVVAAVAVFALFRYEKNKWLSALAPAEPSLSAETVTAKIEAASELVTSKVRLKGMAEYSDGGWYVFNKGDFVMVYESDVKAGIDIKKIQFAIDDDQRMINIFVPTAEILDIKVLPESIKYYNESFSLFNFDKKDDANRAQKMAEEFAKKDALSAGILEMANTQSETLVKGILEEVAHNYEMNFVRSEAELANLRALIDSTKTNHSATADSTNTAK